MENVGMQVSLREVAEEKVSGKRRTGELGTTHH